MNKITTLILGMVLFVGCSPAFAGDVTYIPQEDGTILKQESLDLEAAKQNKEDIKNQIEANNVQIRIRQGQIDSLTSQIESYEALNVDLNQALDGISAIVVEP